MRSGSKGAIQIIEAKTGKNGIKNPESLEPVVKKKVEKKTLEEL